MDIKPVKQKTVVFQVMEQLKEMIASGNLKPNDKVPNEYELAEMFGVGRSTIREALKIFQYLGVVELKNPKGTFISESSKISSEALLWSMLLGKKDLKNLLELRLVLEHQGLWYLMEYHKGNKSLLTSTVAALNQEIENLKKAIEANDTQKRVEADYSFHKHIIAACQNDLFNDLYQTMRSFSYEEFNVTQSTISDKNIIINEHTELVGEILKGDFYKTTKLFRKHIRNSDPLFKGSTD